MESKSVQKPSLLEAILSMAEEKDLTVKELLSNLDISLKDFSNVVLNNTNLNAKLVKNLANLFDTSEQYWYNILGTDEDTTISAIITVMNAGFAIHTTTHWASNQSEWYQEPTYNLTKHRMTRGTLYSSAQETAKHLLYLHKK